MKSFVVLAALTAFYGVEAASNSTIICPDCPAPSSTNDIVTREPVPTTSCTAPALTTVPVLTTSIVQTTKVYTITSCPPEVTNCPIGKKTSVVTSYTTVCPVSTPGAGNQPPASASNSGGNKPSASASNPGGIQTSASWTAPGGANPTGSVPPSSTGTVPVVGAASSVSGNVAAIMAIAAAAAYML